MTTADKLKEEALAQIAAAEKRFSGLPPTMTDCTEFNVMALAAIERIAGKQHAYSKQARKSAERWVGGIGSDGAAAELYGIIQALKHDVENGYLVEFSELEHANLFADFVEMGDHLLEKGYKDPAAVLIGSVLESHLRQLSQKNGLPVADIDSSSKSVPRKADRLNTELARAAVYNMLDQKQVTAWLDLRNKAAHGHYSEYSRQQVESFSQDLKSFMLRHPA